VRVHGSKVSKWIREKYGRNRWYDIIDKEAPIPPIHLVQNKAPMNYSPQKEKTTENNLEKETRRMMEGYVKGSIWTLNNKVSKYIAQKGICAIADKFLKAGEAHAHHREPKANGGNDEYKNIIILSEEAHRLVHATQSETVSLYLKNLNLTSKGIRAVNRLRRTAGNWEIMAVQELMALKES